MTTVRTLPVVALLAGLAVVPLTACGGSSSSTSSAPASSSPSASALASGWPTTAPATGTTITGKGYAYTVPKGWQDVKAKVEASVTGLDTAVANTADADGFSDNVNVIVTADKDTTSQAGLADQMKAEYTKAGATAITVLPESTLAGEKAVRLEATMKNSQGLYHVEQWVASHGDNTYIITLSANKEATTAVVGKTFSSLLQTWSWA